MREQILACVRENKIVSIVRGVENEKAMKTAQALYDGGIRMMELTYNQRKPETWEATARTVGELAKAFAGRMYIGAGTVTNEELVELTHWYGGQFIVSPDVNEAVIRRTRELGMVSMPGALTPTEVMCAYRAGADFVKLFPAGNLGPAYMKLLCAPLSHVPMLAVGAIDDTNLAEYLEAGAVGAGIGGCLTNLKWIEAEEYHKVTEMGQKLMKLVRSAR